MTVPSYIDDYASRHDLSALQRLIVWLLYKRLKEGATYEDDPFGCGPDWETPNDWRTWCLRAGHLHHQVRELYYDEHSDEGWGSHERKRASAAASISRSLRRLRKDGIAGGYALAWHSIDGVYDGWLCWQGGHRKKKYESDRGHFYDMETPRIKYYYLSSEASKEIATLDPDVCAIAAGHDNDIINRDGNA